MPFVEYKKLKPKFCSTCLVCNAIVDEYDDPRPCEPVICAECKSAILYAKKLQLMDDTIKGNNNEQI